MKVYIVAYSMYDDHEICDVFSSKERAVTEASVLNKQYQKEYWYSDPNYEPYDVEEWEVKK